MKIKLNALELHCFLIVLKDIFKEFEGEKESSKMRKDIIDILTNPKERKEGPIRTSTGTDGLEVEFDTNFIMHLITEYGLNLVQACKHLVPLLSMIEGNKFNFKEITKDFFPEEEKEPEITFITTVLTENPFKLYKDISEEEEKFNQNTKELEEEEDFNVGSKRVVIDKELLESIMKENSCSTEEAIKIVLK